MVSTIVLYFISDYKTFKTKTKQKTKKKFIEKPH